VSKRKVPSANTKAGASSAHSGEAEKVEEMSKDLTQYVPTGQAARMLGVSSNHIRLLLGRGKLRGVKLGHEWIVFIPSIEKYRDSKSAKGRPASGVPSLGIAN
jgi:hypothetical protein